MEQYNYIYCEGSPTQEKDVCLKTNNDAEIWVHTQVLSANFNYFQGYFGFEAHTDKIIIERDFAAVDILMKSAYGNHLTKNNLMAQIPRNYWFVLFDVLELHDFWCPTNSFDDCFDYKIVTELIVEYSDSSNICDMLTRIDLVNTNLVRTLRSQLFEKNRVALQLITSSHVFYYHWICSDKSNVNTKLLSIPYNTRCMMDAYFSTYSSAMTKLTKMFTDFSSYVKYYDLTHPSISFAPLKN